VTAAEPGASEEVVIRLEGFSCRYAPTLPHVLHEVDLEIRRGECVFVLGAGGSGKTTLGLAIAGVVPHVLGQTEGAVYVLGKRTTDCTVPELATRIGMVFQDVESQLCMLRVRDEVAFGPENFRFERDTIIAGVEQALAFVGLQGFEDHSVFELSGGEKQKVALASVLAGGPQILFLDEPAANLDPRSSAEIADIVRRLKRSKTILVFENKVDEFLPEADRLVVLDKGRVVLDGPPRAILAEHGDWLSNELGVWIPQVSALALELLPPERRDPASMPLTVGEAVTLLESSFVEHIADEGQAEANGRPEATADTTAPGSLVADARSISYHYDPERPAAIHDVSLTIAEGEWLAIVGPNGSGKTTLAKHLIGLLRPQSGSMLVLSKDTRSTSVRELARLVGYVFQNPEHQFVADTVDDELGFSLRAAGADEATLSDKVHQTVEHFDLVGLERRHPYSLSGGEKRRLSVATMLITRPRLLILDEPTYGLDRRNTQQMMRAIVESASARDDGYAATVAMVTHDMRLVADYATSAAVMSNGRLVYRGPIAGLFADEDLLVRCNLEVPPISRLERLLSARGKALPVYHRKLEAILRE
jgi:energy-coupling factor transport system ATP-binding protein